MIRLFVAVPVPPDLTLMLQSLQSGLPGAQWLPPAGLHLTLRFIGEVDNGQARDIDAALAGIQAPAGLLEVAGLGHFGSAETARTLWAGVARDPALLHLHSKVESALVRAGLPPEGRRYTPHISLAMFRRQPLEPVMRWCAEREPFRGGDLPLDRFCLYSSHRTGTGPYYRVEAIYPLAGGGWEEEADAWP